MSLILTGVLIPKILLISFRKNLFDTPDERKIHQGAVPRLGGIAFMPSIILSMALVAGVNMLCKRQLYTGGFDITVGAQSITICFGICALMMLYLIGVADDLIGVKYRAKFVVQIIAAVLLVISGLIIDDLHGLFGIHEIPLFLSAPLMVVVIVFIVNAINLIDGIDGLASGLSAIAAGCYGIKFLMAGEYVCALLSVATLGTLVQFFYYNVFGNTAARKKIFMGDTGSLTIGIVLSFLSIEMYMLGDRPGPRMSDAAVWAYAPLLVPCLDVVRVFFHRIIRGRSPFLPDRVHIHHKLLALGMRPRMAMIFILLVSLMFIGLDVMADDSGLNLTWIVLIDLAVWVVFNYLLTRMIRRRQHEHLIAKELYD